MRYPQIIRLSYTILATILLHSSVWGQEMPNTSPDEPTMAVEQPSHRSNPFEAITFDISTPSLPKVTSQGKVAPPVMRVVGNEEMRLKTVDLKYLDAKTAAEAVTPFASRPEAITVVTSTNSLFICDSQSRVKRILSELEVLDVRGSGFMVEMIPLKYLDAESVGKALKPLTSSDGIVTPAERNNAVMVSDFQKNIDMMREKVRAMDVPAGALQMRTINLKFLQAKNLMPVIQQMVEDNGSVGVNAESNSIMICATAEKMEQIVAEIKAADRSPEQILVEVVLMDVRLDDDTEIGVNWDMITSEIKDVSYRQNTSANRVKSTISSDETLGNATAYNSTSVLGGDLAIVSGAVRAVLHMIQEKSDVEIIASPRTMVMSGTSGTIRAVEEVPYTELKETDEGGEMTSTQFKEVGVILEVKATLTEENRICLDVSVEQNVRTGESDSGVPVVDTRSQENTLFLEDGQTVVMGGLRRSETTEILTQIPLLSSIPLVGELFKNTTTSISHSELVVLVSPHIYRGQEIPETVTKRVSAFEEEFDQIKMSVQEISN